MDSLTRTAFFREVVKLSSVAVGGQQYEEMNTPRWKQVAKDAPAVVLGSAVGYGIGKVIAEELGERAARQAMQQGAHPNWIRAVPPVAMASATLGTLASLHLHHKLKQRRDAADAEAQAKKTKAPAR